MSVDNNKFLMNSITTDNFLHDCIELAIDGFLFRGIKPSDHYYHFSKSFPRAFTLSNFTTTLKQPTKNNLSQQKTALTSIQNSQTSVNDQYLSKNSTVLIDISKFTQSDLINHIEKEVHDIQERMRKHRLKNNRPDDLSKMTIKQIYDEKIDMQQELLKFEKKYSKPTIAEQKRIVKPIYDYYRQLKRLVEKQQ